MNTGINSKTAAQESSVRAIGYVQQSLADVSRHIRNNNKPLATAAANNVSGFLRLAFEYDRDSTSL